MPLKTSTVPLLALLLAGCGGSGDLYIQGGLWDTNTVSSTDSTYVRLPYSGELIQIQETAKGGIWSVVDLDGAEPTSMTAAPDGTQVLVFSKCQSAKTPTQTSSTSMTARATTWSGTPSWLWSRVGFAPPSATSPPT